jgi:hypothetical protein
MIMISASKPEYAIALEVEQEVEALSWALNTRNGWISMMGL